MLKQKLQIGKAKNMLSINSNSVHQETGITSKRNSHKYLP